MGARDQKKANDTDLYIIEGRGRAANEITAASCSLTSQKVDGFPMFRQESACGSSFLHGCEFPSRFSFS